jgi:metallophosphoesterase (TIGR00282 family)
VRELRILFLGDVVGPPGLSALKDYLPFLVAETGPSLVIANGENSAAGLGITEETARQIRSAGVSVVTTGNHIWDKKQIVSRLNDLPWVLRPANYPPEAPGRGWCVTGAAGVPVAVINLSGRIFMDPLDCPFHKADQVIAELPPQVKAIVVDFHAEATSEKRALGWHLDGRVSAVIGTHTHVPTADAQVLPGGTGYITDVGMTGVADSVIGVPKEEAIERFVTQVRSSLGVATGRATVCGALVRVDADTGRCIGLKRIECGGPQKGPAGGRESVSG